MAFFSSFKVLELPCTRGFFLLASVALITGCPDAKLDAKPSAEKPASEKQANKGDKDPTPTSKTADSKHDSAVEKSSGESAGRDNTAPTTTASAPSLPDDASVPENEAKGDSDAGKDGDPDPAPAPTKEQDEQKKEEQKKADQIPAGPSVKEQKKSLAKSIADARRSDADALKDLEALQKLGASKRELASALNARGLALFGDATRAKDFFEQARKADPKDANASFHLAKLASIAGDIRLTKDLLQEVVDRGGKKLLKNVAFDPMFALVADDPEVQKLAR